MRMLERSRTAEQLLLRVLATEGGGHPSPPLQKIPGDVLTSASYFVRSCDSPVRLAVRIFQQPQHLVPLLLQLLLIQAQLKRRARKGSADRLSHH